MSRKMKIIGLILALLLSVSLSFGQSLSVFDVDASNFPTIKAKFFAFDKDGNQLTNLNPSDFELKENGQPRIVTNVSCPDPQPPVALSSVLIFDVSGSMSGAPLDMEKAVANTWINMLPLGNSDCAITSFSDDNYINQDFTTNKSKLINGINSLGIICGTDYNAAMIDPAAGGILMAKTGKHKRIIIFLTDGQPNFEPRTQEIIDEAKANNIIIYCLSMYSPAHHTMIEFSNQTGGLYFENIKSQEEAEDALRKIFALAQNSDMCEIKWESGSSCFAGITNVELQITNLGVKATTNYQSPNTSIAKLEFNPISVKFPNPYVGVKVEKRVTVTARNVNFTITNITSNNTAFEITPSSFTLNSGESKELTVSYLPVDSGYVFVRFDIENDICPTRYYASGGFFGIKPKFNTIKLLHPNGSEIFVAGSDTVITWEGIPKSDTVQLEYTIDNGTTWKTITDKASGLQYIWKNIPKPPSVLCKVRIKQINNPSDTENGSDLLLTLIGHTGIVDNVSWSPDGSRVATASWDNTAKIWDAVNGAMLHTLNGHNREVRTVSWSPDGSRVATSGYGDTPRIWDAVNGATLHTLSGHKSEVWDVSWSPDGSRVATASYDYTARIWDAVSGTTLHTLIGHTISVYVVSWSPDGSRVATAGWDNLAKIWDVASGAILHTLIGHTGSVSDVRWSPDGSRVATAGNDSTARIWDSKTGDIQHTLNGHTDKVMAVRWSPEGSEVVTASRDNTAIIWGVASGTKLNTLIGHTDYVNAVSWSPDGSHIATASYDKTAKIWDAMSGANLNTLNGHIDEVWDVSWSPDGSKVATASYDKTAKIWYVGGNKVLQEDESDSVFAIVAPQASAKNIDMKECLVGMIKDSVISNVIENTGSYPIRIDSIYFTGADALNFRLLSRNLPQTINAGDKIDLEFGFGPGRVGLHSADMIILTQSDTLFKRIIGTGFEPQLAVSAKIIDFGQLEIGKERTFIDTALVKNISLSPITINNVIQMGPDKTQFEILSSLNSFTLQPGEEKKLTLKFKPIYGGRTTGQIAFSYSGVGSPVIVGLFGTGIGGNLRISNDSSYAGESRNLKLIMEKAKPEGIAALAPNFEATIRFQNTILAPLNNPNWTISNDSTYLKVAGKFGTSNDIAQIPVIAGLGSVEETAIDIVDFVLKDDAGSIVDYDFEFESGTFKLLGICYEGGARLINPNNKVELLQISPNPNDGNLAVELNLIEEGSSTLSIYNSNGQLMYEQNITSSTGKIDLNVDTKEYGNGLYFVSLQTPTIRKVKQLVVFK